MRVLANCLRHWLCYNMPMPNKRLTKENVAALIPNCTTIRELMRKMGYKSYAGGSGHYLSKKIREWGIDTSHMLGKAWNIGSGRKGGCPRKTAEQILVYHADGQRQRAVHLRRALVEIGRMYKCDICGVSEWLEKPLILEVEHRDGDFQNDRPDNICFICPNCHSQTPTFCRIKSSLGA